MIAAPKKGDLRQADYYSAIGRLEEDELTEEDRQKYRVKRLKDKYLVSDTAIVEIDEDKLTQKQRDMLDLRREDLASAVAVYKRELDPGLFYEKIEPSRAKELAGRIDALRADNHLRYQSKTGHH